MPNGFTRSEPTEYSRRFPWRVFWLLLIASLGGAAAAIPLVLVEFAPLVQRAPSPSLPLPLLVVVGVAQNAVFLGLLIGIGLLLGRRIGLSAPLLESWLYHEEAGIRVRGPLKYGALVGASVGIVLLGSLLIAAPYMPGLPFISAAHAALWKRVLVCFYGGIDEEVLSRLFLLSLVAWLGTRVFQSEKTRPSTATFWSANIIVAILFGLGHLPNAAMVMHITPAVVVLALALNGIAAVSFGYLYWKRGFEAAMIAHFCADFVVYVVGPAFLRTR